MRSQIAGLLAIVALQAFANDAFAQSGTNASGSAPAASSAALTRAQVKADTAKATKAGTAPVDQYDGEARVAVHPASSPKFHFRHKKSPAASSAASATH